MALASGSPYVIRAVLEDLVRKKFQDDPASVPLGAAYRLYITPRAHIGIPSSQMRCSGGAYLWQAAGMERRAHSWHASVDEE
jgi:hypothetical protein